MARRSRNSKKSGGSSFPVIGVVIVALALGLLGFGLYREFSGARPMAQLAKVEKEAIPDIPIDELSPIEFELNNPENRYFYIDWRRGMNSAPKWSAIPHNARGVVAVVTPETERVKAFYIANLWEAKNGRGVAKPMTRSQFEALANNVAMASYWATDLSDAVVDTTLEIETQRIRRKHKRDSKPRTQIRRLNKLPSFDIPGLF